MTVAHPLDTRARDIMIALAQFYEVQQCLQKLATYNIIKQESVLKGMQKFLREHPIIKEHLERELGNVHTRILADMPRVLKQHLERELNRDHKQN